MTDAKESETGANLSRSGCQARFLRLLITMVSGGLAACRSNLAVASKTVAVQGLIRALRQIWEIIPIRDPAANLAEWYVACGEAVVRFGQDGVTCHERCPLSVSQLISELTCFIPAQE